jgi:hypothetical protein
MNRPSTQTRVILHNHPRQPHGCLSGLAHYAQSISETALARSFPDLQAAERWILRQPVKLDLGEGPVSAGCVPAQRSRIWPQDGLNCWEATGHYVGVALAQGLPVEVHVFDRDFGPFRHVYPAVRRLGDRRPPVPVLLQSSMPKPRAQEWWNDVLGGVHMGGSAVLGVFGMGGIVPQIERVQGDALPSWARVHSQPRPPFSTQSPGGPVPGAPPGGPVWTASPVSARPPVDPSNPTGAAPLVRFSNAAEYLSRSPYLSDGAYGRFSPPQPAPFDPASGL